MGDLDATEIANLLSEYHLDTVLDAVGILLERESPENATALIFAWLARQGAPMPTVYGA